MQLFPSLSALLQWILGPQMLLVILLANRIIAQQFLGRSYSGMYSQRSCPFVFSGFIGDVIESGHNVRWVWRAPSFHSKFFLRNTHHLLPYWGLHYWKWSPPSVKVKSYSSSDDMLFIEDDFGGVEKYLRLVLKGGDIVAAFPAVQGQTPSRCDCAWSDTVHLVLHPCRLTISACFLVWTASLVLPTGLTTLTALFLPLIKNYKLTSAPGSFHSIPPVKHLTAAISLVFQGLKRRPLGHSG